MRYLHDHKSIHDPLLKLLKQDKIFRTLAGRDDLFQWKQASGQFAHFVDMVISQQISTKAADAIYKKLAAQIDGRITAEKFLKLTEKQYRAAGLSYQKIDYLIGLAESVIQKKFVISRLKSMPDSDVIDAITSLKGFGIWSAQMYLIFSLARPDVWPYGDLGIQKA